MIWFFTFIAILLSGCDDFIIPLHDRLHKMEKEPEEKVDWVGTWSLESIDGVHLNDLFEAEGEIIYSVANWTFEADGTWWASFQFEFIIGEGIGGEFWMELWGTYVLDGANYVLNIEMDAPDSFFASDQNTGTWRIENDTLTLVDDQGTVILFYRNDGAWLDLDAVEPPEPQESPLD